MKTKIVIVLLLSLVIGTTLSSATNHLKINEDVNETSSTPSFRLKLDYNFARDKLNGDIKINGIRYVYVQDSFVLRQGCFSFLFKENGVIIDVHGFFLPTPYPTRLHVNGFWCSDALGLHGFFDIMGVLS